MIFFRGTHAAIHFTVTPEAVPGVTDFRRIENFYESEGRMSIYHFDTAQRWDVPMAGDGTKPPAIVKGVLPLFELPNGWYQIQGQAFDTKGGRGVISYDFEIRSGGFDSKCERRGIRLEGSNSFVGA